jgi:hypothetical protein
METPLANPGMRFGLYRRIVASVAATGMSLALAASARPVNPSSEGMAFAAPAAVVEACDAPPDRVNDWNHMMSSVEGWNSGDGITSVELPLGKLIISAADNVGLNSEGQPKFRRNSLLSVCGLDAKTVDRDTEAIPSVGDEWYWPGEMVVSKKQDKLYVFANRTAKTREANADNGADLGSFTGTGVDLAVFSVPKTIDEDPTFLYMAKTPASNSPEVDSDGVRRTKQWGASIVEGQDGYVYVYGSHVDPRPYNVARDAYVARVKLEQLEQPDAWEYFSGKDGWTNHETAATPIINSAEQPGLDVTWTTSYKDGRYTIISKRDGAFGTELGEWAAKAPTGPFAYRKLAQLNPFTPKAMTYNAHSHPAVKLWNGALLVSICQNTNGDLKYVHQYPEKHRPIWLSVEQPAPRKPTR